MMVNIWLVYEFPLPVKISEALLLSDSSARLWTGTQFTVMTCDVKPILLSVVVQAKTIVLWRQIYNVKIVQEVEEDVKISVF